MASPLIQDMWLYNGEPVAEARINYLAGKVDRFIVIEGRHTFSGQRKDRLYVEDAPWANRPDVDVFVYEAAPTGDVWAFEHAQRDVGRHLVEDGLVIASDVDEIPKWEAVQRGVGGVWRLDMDFYYYNLSWRKPQRWVEAVLADVEIIRRYGPQALRGRVSQRLNSAGWHLSYFESAENIRRKIESFSHQEFNDESFKAVDHLRECLQSGKDLFRRLNEDCSENTDLSGIPQELIDFDLTVRTLQK